MSEAVAFFCGLVTMTIVWFVNDTKNNPYMRGYAEGLNYGVQGKRMHWKRNTAVTAAQGW